VFIIRASADYLLLKSEIYNLFRKGEQGITGGFHKLGLGLKIVEVLSLPLFSLSISKLIHSWKLLISNEYS
jgi:hypothetical protein